MRGHGGVTARVVTGGTIRVTHPVRIDFRPSHSYVRQRCRRNPNAIQYVVKSAVIPQIRVEPELRADLESVLQPGETLTDFVESTVRNAIAFRRVQTAFHARAQAASEEYHRTHVSVPVETVLERLQAKLDAKRKKLGR